MKQISKGIITDFLYLTAGIRIYVIVFGLLLFLYNILRFYSDDSPFYEEALSLLAAFYVVFLIGDTINYVNLMKVRILIPLTRADIFIITIVKPFLVLIFNYIVILLLYMHYFIHFGRYNDSYSFPYSDNPSIYLLAIPLIYFICYLGPLTIIVLPLLAWGISYLGKFVDLMIVFSIISHPLISLPLAALFIHLIYKNMMEDEYMDFENYDYEEDNYEYDEETDCD